METTLNKSISKVELDKIRDDFPMLSVKVHGKPLIYFDNGATSQKPNQVIDAITNYYKKQNSNIHRGVHFLSREITIAFEKSRSSIASHLHLSNANEIIFTKGTTDGINLVANTYGKKYLNVGDEILISEMEHHSNILPWQVLCEEKGCVLKIIPIDETGSISIDKVNSLITAKTKFISLTHVSNSLGTINPVKEIIELAHKKNIPVLVDGAQSIPHMDVNVSDLDCDFFVFSGHKVFGPTGIGVLYMKDKWMKNLPPYQTGGGTIKTVTFEKTEYAEGPLKFEAGTPHIEGAIGLSVALEYISTIGLDKISAWEHELLSYAESKLSLIPEVKLIGTSNKKASVISFIVNGAHPFDVGTLLDQQGIAVRTGHHCTQPIMAHFGIPGTIRASFAFYNTKEEIDFFIEGLNKSIKMLL